MNPRTKNCCIIAACCVAISTSAFFILRGREAPAQSSALHRLVGEVMAEQTAKLAGRKGQIVCITVRTSANPGLEIQLAAFRKRLRQLGDYQLSEEKVDPKGRLNYGLGKGISGSRFVKTVNKNPKADVIVSFIGAPGLSDQEISELKKMPRFIAEAGSPKHLPVLFQKGILQAAVVSRFVYPSPGPHTPRTPAEWVDSRYQIIGPEAAQLLFSRAD